MLQRERGFDFAALSMVTEPKPDGSVGHSNDNMLQPAVFSAAVFLYMTSFLLLL
jgi:hypothetical protein